MKKDQLQTPELRKLTAQFKHTIHRFLPHPKFQQLKDLESQLQKTAETWTKIKDIYCCDYSGNLDGIFNNDSQENDHEDYESDKHEDLECFSNQPSVSAFAILNTVFLKMNIVLDLSKDKQ